MSNLYDLKNEYLELLGMDAGDEAEFQEALENTLGASREMTEDKLEKTLLVARSLESEADACKAEANRLAERAKRFSRNADACKDRVKQAMIETGITKVKRTLLSFTLVKGRDVCQVVDAKAIPAKYLVEKVSINPDKAAILKALKAGEEVEGCGLAEGAASLRIS